MKIRRFEHTQRWDEVRELTNKITVVPKNGSTAERQHRSTTIYGGEDA